MSRVVVIGGTGHVGTFLIPRLVQTGHDVVVVSRSLREPYQPHAAWESVERVAIDRMEAEEDGTFGKRISDLEPEVVIDMICFTEASARHLVKAVRGRVQHFLHCGTVWVHGPSFLAPSTEAESRNPFGDYGIRKSQIEAYLLDEAHRNGFPATVVHPGHVVGPGWTPLNPTGNFDPDIYRKLAQGEEVLIPHFGMETVHHVHADDVAQAFTQSMLNWSASVGEAFHAVSPAAVSLRGYAHNVASWFGQEANLRFVPWDEFEKEAGADHAKQTYEHILHSPSCSMEKGRRLIGYEPRYTSYQAVYESVMWMVSSGEIEV